MGAPNLSRDSRTMAAVGVPGARPGTTRAQTNNQSSDPREENQMSSLPISSRVSTSIAVLTAAMLAITACSGTGVPATTSTTGPSGSAPLGSASADEGLLTTLRSRGVIRIANTQAAPPWDFLDQGNSLVGYNVDVGNEIARRLGIAKVQFIQGNYDTFVEGLKADKWDLVISGQTPTAERLKVIDFSCTYQVSASAIWVNDTNATIKSDADLVGKRIAVAAGSTEEEDARKIAGATVLVYPNYLLSLSDVSVGRADATVGSRFVGAYLAKGSGLKVKAVPSGTVEANGMSFPKDQPALKAAINKALADMITDGTLTTISKKWLGGLDMVDELKKLPPCSP